ncbi:VWA domain-containing protein [Rhodobacteraceae bacterium CCMM004]|nr:VWA domain-containing protein [Rhodobacteraceae bacterium CCMM004]
MTRAAPLPQTDGRLTENVVHFARALRRAGVRVGTAQVEDAVRAVAAAGFSRKVDFYHTLRATLITRPEHLELYHQVFAMFWRDPEFLEHMIHLMSPAVRRDDERPRPKSAERRAAEALTDRPEPPRRPDPPARLEVEAHVAWSSGETLRARDFEQMSAEEAAAAARMVSRLALPVPPVRVRRCRPASQGPRPDLRATLRGALRRGGEVGRIVRRRPQTRPPDLVALVDISGSMASYSRMLLLFLHALATAPGDGWGRVHGFTFGTRLTDVSRALRGRDPDAALAEVGREAQDWQGGTRIGAALERFNKDWSRRVLGRGATVLLITDGLERGDADLLAREAERLHLSCRRLIWLNPLLRWEGFAPKARGIRVLLDHSDLFLPCHSLDSLAAVADVLSSDRAPRG